MNKTEQPELVGIVTVTYNSGSVLQDFFRSLETQTSRNFRIWAVDNASTDDSVAQLRAWNDPRLEVVANHTNVGVAAGNNQGIAAALGAGCDCILLLNNDVVFGPDLIDGLLRGMADYGCSMTVPLIYYAEPDNMIWSAGGTFRKNFACLSFHFGFREIDRGQFSKARPVEFAPSSCTMIKREVFDRIGLMDERYFVGAEDTDFMYRALQSGFATYYLPDVKMWHKVSSLRGEDSPFSQRYMVRNRAFFIRKHFGGWTSASFTFIYRVYYATRFVFGKDSWETMLRKVRAWSEGLRIT